MEILLVKSLEQKENQNALLEGISNGSDKS